MSQEERRPIDQATDTTVNFISSSIVQNPKEIAVIWGKDKIVKYTDNGILIG